MVSTFLKKVQDMIRGPFTMSEDDTVKEDELLIFFRKQLIIAIQQRNDCKDLTTSVVHVTVSSFIKKYAMLNVTSLLLMNNQGLAQLKTIVHGLSMIIKYATCLLYPEEVRKEGWNVFPFNDQHVQTKVTPLAGYDTILNQLGYVQHCDQGLSFQPNTEPNKEIVANLIVDMMLFKEEIKAYLRNTHPQANQLEEFLLQDTVEEVHTYQASLYQSRLTGLTDDDLSSSDEKVFEVKTIPSPDKTKAGFSIHQVNSTANFVHASSPEALSDAFQAEESDPNIIKISQNSDFTMPEVAMPSPVTTHPTSSASGGQSSGSLHIACDVCGGDAQVFCRQCFQKPLCNSCNESFHSHPSRRGHKVEAITNLNNSSLESQPPVQVEGAYGITAQNDTKRRQKFNKSQETEVVKSPSRVNKSSNNNMPALGLLGFNSVGEDIPEQAHCPPLNDAYKRTLEQIQSPGLSPHLPMHFDNLHQNHPTAFMHGNNTPTSTEQVGGFHYYNRTPKTLPLTLLNPSMQQQPGLSQYIGQNLTYRDPYSAQLNYNAGKIRTGQSHNIPQQGLAVGQQMFYYSPEQRHWQPSPERLIPTSYAYDPNYQFPRRNVGELTSVMRGAGMSMASHGLDSKLSPSHPGHFATAAGYSMTNTPNVAQHNTYHSIHPYNKPPQNSMISQTDINFHRDVNNSQTSFINAGGVNEPKASLPTGQFLNSSMNLNQSLGNGSMSSSKSLSPKLQQIMSFPSAQHQLEGCKKAIEGLNVTIQDIQEKIDEILLLDEDHTKNSSFLHLSSDKSQCLKERDCINKYMKRLKETPSRTPSVQENPQSRVIYFPPTVPNTIPQPVHTQGQNINIVVPTAELKDVHIEEHSQQKCVLNEGISAQQSKSNSGKSDCVAIPSQAHSQNKKDMKVSSIRRKQTREPVESSSLETPIRPPVPPRQERKTLELSTLLNKIIAPPSPSQWKTESKNLKWHCEHCTFLNEGTSHICEVCNKTSDNPVMEAALDDSSVIPELEIRDPLLDASISRDNDTTDAIQEGLTENHFQSSSTTPPKPNKIIDFQQQVMNEKKAAQREYALFREKEQQLTLSASNAHVVTDLQKNQTLTNQPQSEAASAVKGVGVTSTIEGMAMSKSEEPPSPKLKPEYNAQKALARRMEMEANEKAKKEGKEFLDLIKAADIKGYKVEAVEIAQIHCKSHNMTPLQWLDENWNKYLEKIMMQVKNVGAAEEHNCIGELSLEEAEMSFLSCHGNVNEAVLLAVENRKELFDYLNSVGSFAREEILQAMLSQKGNISDAEGELMISKLLPFLNRVWDQKDDDRNDNYGLYQYAQAECYNSVSTSIISHDDFQKRIKSKEIDIERRVRMVLVEGKLKSWGRAELVIKILDEYLPNEDISLEDVVDAVRDCHDRQSALVYLQQECLLCLSTFPMNKIRSLNFCQCKMCEECLTKNFEIAIREKHIRNWSCPLCSQPDLTDTEKASGYLHFLTLCLQPLIDKELMNLFETKVRDLHLQKDPHFRWCAHCAFGFLAENPNQLRMTCLNCKNQTCFKCKKQWEDQHENLTCEQFAQWKIENDPSNQAVGLAKHLEENGIDCPSCKMRFALAKGGCMHFHCPECGHEFCSGCNETYYNSGVCQKYKTCKNLGLHCHHPRDCFSYLRDRSVEELQSLLQHHQVVFNVEAPQDQEDSTQCPVMEQKESGNAKKDEKCGKPSEQGWAGLCESHYKEYLTGLINGNCLDPLLLMSVNNMIVLLKRHDFEIPKKSDKETEDAYKAKLSKLIEARLPLKRK